MKIFVTGATGFIGTNLIKRLINEDHEVICFVRNLKKAKKILPENCELLPAKSEDNEIVGALEKVDAVINLAGEPVIKRWSKRNRKKMFRSRVTLTKRLSNLLNQCKKKPKVFISGSAVGYYGDRGNEILNEKSLKSSDRLSYLCDEWENSCGTPSDDMRIVKLRTGVVLGHGGALKKMLLPFKLCLGGILGTGRQWVPWIHIGDMVEIIVSSLTNKYIKGPVNCVAPNPEPNWQFTKQLGITLRRPTPWVIPAFILKLLFGQGSQILLGSQRVKPMLLESIGFEWRYEKLKNALEDLV